MSYWLQTTACRYSSTRVNLTREMVPIPKTSGWRTSRSKGTKLSSTSRDRFTISRTWPRVSMKLPATSDRVITCPISRWLRQGTWRYPTSMTCHMRSSRSMWLPLLCRSKSLPGAWHARILLAARSVRSAATPWTTAGVALAPARPMDSASAAQMSGREVTVHSSQPSLAEAWLYTRNRMDPKPQNPKTPSCFIFLYLISYKFNFFIY